MPKLSCPQRQPKQSRGIDGRRCRDGAQPLPQSLKIGPQTLRIHFNSVKSNSTSTSNTDINGTSKSDGNATEKADLWTRDQNFRQLRTACGIRSCPIRLLLLVSITIIMMTIAAATTTIIITTSIITIVIIILTYYCWWRS